MSDRNGETEPEERERKAASHVHKLPLNGPKATSTVRWASGVYTESVRNPAPDGLQVERFGALEVGATLPGGFRVAGLWVTGTEALIRVAREGTEVLLALPGRAGRADRGPFDERVDLTYRQTAVPFAELEPAGRELARRVAQAIGDADPREAVQDWLDAARDQTWSGEQPTRVPVEEGLAADHPELLASDWHDEARRLLTDADAVVPITRFLSAEALPRRDCILPWVRLELGMEDRFGPCCSDFQTATARGGGGLLESWRSPAMQAFRRALRSPGHPVTCGASCPRLVGRSDALETLLLHGGPRSLVDNQLCAVDDLLVGAEQPTATPLVVCFVATTFCNYDCLMCRCGADGTLDDERSPSFYDSLGELLPGLTLIEALGGEPLASPAFREFLAGDALRAHPHARVSLTTNGSYLTPDELERLGNPLSHVTLSLNAATAGTYGRVNRGLPLARIRDNIDALLERRRRTGFPRSITYSMVLLRDNLHELRDFAALCRRDAVGIRFMLPMHDRNGQSILTDLALMRTAEAALREVAREEWARGQARDSRRARGEADVLAGRIARGVVRSLPDPDGLLPPHTLLRP